MRINLITFSRSNITKLVCLTLAFLALTNCESNSSTKNKNSSNSSASSASKPSEFSLRFKAMVGSSELNCNDIYSGFGPNQNYQIGVGDLRFYVSNLKFYDNNGGEIAVALNSNDFQLNHPSGSVSLIDFSGKESGYCEIASEGTARTNNVITGQVADNRIASVSFDVGVPQATMKAVIAATDEVTDTPSPLGEMYWSWASGYRHFVMNFTAMDATHTEMVENSGFHIGSRDCGGAGKALSDKEACGLLNTPQVMLSNFDPSVDSVVVDVAKLLASIQEADFGGTENFGIQCHSGTPQTACHSLFPNFGLEFATGTATAANNKVFNKE